MIIPYLDHSFSAIFFTVRSLSLDVLLADEYSSSSNCFTSKSIYSVCSHWLSSYEVHLFLEVWPRTLDKVRHILAKVEAENAMRAILANSRLNVAELSIIAWPRIQACDVNSKSIGES